jgi:elongation factor P
MATAGLNDVKKGMKILHNNDPWVITDADFIKPGKGQAFTRIFIRNLKNGRTTEQTMKSSDSFEVADVVDTDMQYLYSDGEFWHFMHQESFEQHQASKVGMGDRRRGARAAVRDHGRNDQGRHPHRRIRQPRRQVMR